MFLSWYAYIPAFRSISDPIAGQERGDGPTFYQESALDTTNNEGAPIADLLTHSATVLSPSFRESLPSIERKEQTREEGA